MKVHDFIGGGKRETVHGVFTLPCVNGASAIGRINQRHIGKDDIRYAVRLFIQQLFAPFRVQ